MTALVFFNFTKLYKSFAQMLNVVIITKTNPKTGAFAHVILFSSDMKLSFDTKGDRKWKWYRPSSCKNHIFGTKMGIPAKTFHNKKMFPVC